MSVDNYFTWQYIPEDKSELHTWCRENLKSHKICSCMLLSFWVRCGRLSRTVVRQLWSAGLECRITREVVSCHRRTVHLGTVLVCSECSQSKLAVVAGILVSNKDPSWIESTSNCVTHYNIDRKAGCVDELCLRCSHTTPHKSTDDSTQKS
jgi:hypothetical protein